MFLCLTDIVRPLLLCFVTSRPLFALYTCALLSPVQGEYVAPEKVETVYMQSRFVAQCFVFGFSSEVFENDDQILTRMCPCTDRLREAETGTDAHRRENETMA